MNESLETLIESATRESLVKALRRALKSIELYSGGHCESARVAIAKILNVTQ